MSSLIPLESDEGQKLLASATYHQDAIIKHFAKQTHNRFCAIRTAAITMNAMQQCTEKNAIYQEKTMFSLPQTCRVLDKATVEQKGCTLQETADLYKAFHYKVKIYHANESTQEELQCVAMETLSNSNNRSCLIVNYHMEALGQGLLCGHVSPIAAYHQDTDRLLLMDVWPYTKEIWATTGNLYAAMNTLDDVSHKTRGFLVVQVDE